MGLLDQCEEVFGTSDLYQVLGVRPGSSEAEIRRGYRKVSLQVHPDRVTEAEKEAATQKFQVTVADIKNFEDKYKGSEEELADIKQAYLEFQGDMDSIMESVLCSTTKDESRIRDILKKAIEAQELPAYTAFTKESAKKQRSRKRRGDKEAKEAEAVREELGLEAGADSLRNLIQSKQKNREKDMNSFLAALEAKYSGNSQKGGKKGKK
ncbi:dnaJ homolog subfamily C member 9 isoform X2 [Narcine bancroftii]|uniref:dnaJ homolog subfamily C member 9 isoform X2 n=1 Tax=Narcine bancroftii TaxID=1343680 RepID=UPI003831FAAD